MLKYKKSAVLAQLVEQYHGKVEVVGSIPIGGTIFLFQGNYKMICLEYLYFII